MQLRIPFLFLLLCVSVSGRASQIVADAAFAQANTRFEQLYNFQHEAHRRETRRRGSTHSLYDWAKMVEKEFGDLYPNEQHIKVLDIFRATDLIQHEVTNAPHIYEREQVLEDLEILSGKRGARGRYLGATLNRAQTAYGAASGNILYALPYDSIPVLQRR